MSKQQRIPLIIHQANAEDEATHDAFEIFEFRTILGARRQIRVPRAELGDSKRFLELLISKNIDLPSGKLAMPSEVGTAMSAVAQSHWLYCNALGWRLNHKSFVSGKKIFGKQTASKRQLMPPIWMEEHDTRLGERGTLEGWKRSVAGPSLMSSVATFAIAAAFGAALISPLGRHSFGFNIFGRSKSGKSTGLLAGASVIGIGQEVNLPNWAATGVATIESARMFNDMMLPLNEMGLISGGEKDIYNYLRQMIYRLGEGIEARRSVKSVYAVDLKRAKFRTIFVSTSEKSVSEYARVANAQRDAGEFARCLDIPMSVSGSDTIMDNITASANSASARSLIINLRRAVAENYGTAYPAYISYLCANREAIIGKINTYIEKFKALVDAANLDDVEQHALENLAIVFVGGQLAIDAEIVPWDPKTYGAIMKGVFQMALAEARSGGVAHRNVQDGAMELERRLLKVVSKLPRKKHVQRDEFALGFIESNGDKKRCVLRASSIRHAMGISSLGLAEFLKKGGLLDPKQTSKSNASDWYQRSIKWPGTGIVRSVVFEMPPSLRRNE